MHCEQRMLATEINWLVRTFSVIWHQALKRMEMHCEQRKVATEVNCLVQNFQLVGTKF